MPRARPEYTLLGSLIGANLQLTSDQAFVMNATPPKYIVKEVLATNSSVVPVLAAGGVYTATAKGGTAIVGAAQVYTALTATTKYLALTLGAAVGTDILTSAQLYLSLTTANVAAGTADFYIFGEILVN